ncbi:MAG: hypothetical protein KGL19_00535 [Bacteroidota bacterium]|nr:hypothetical protein [Bacteroidota bacterium]
MKYFEIKDHSVSVIVPGYSLDLYYFAERTLPATIDLDGKLISKWVLHICQKSWACREMIQELEQIIKSKFPDNDIDWDSTMEEASFYLSNTEDYFKSKGVRI